LIEDLKKQVEKEAMSEAASYDEFACFCKTMTEKKGTTIEHHHDAIADLSAEIQEVAANKIATSLEIEELKKQMEFAHENAKNYTVRCEQEQANFVSAIADISKGIIAIENAHKALVASKPDAMMLLSVQQTVQKCLALANSLNLGFKQQAKGPNVSPKDAAYQYHSQGILDTIVELKATFQQKKETEDLEQAKAKVTCGLAIGAFSEMIKTATTAVAEAKEKLLALEQQMAKAKESLTHTKTLLEDDEVYIKDLTISCETRAHDWDQRTSMRAKELEALAGALAILKDKVAGLDADVNQRVLLLSKVRSTKKRSLTAVSFLQEERPTVWMHSSSHHPVQVLVQAHADAQVGVLMARQSNAAELLSRTAGRTQSVALSMLALRVTTDPFTEVKALIQKLIERLLREATSEATKKGFCDEAMSKAEATRDRKFEEIEKLQVELGNLEVKQDSLKAEIDELSASLEQQRCALAKAGELREQDFAMNTETVAKAERGEETVTEALAILRTFYKQEAALLQASPVDEDTSGPSFSGSYLGKREAANGIIGILEVILSDFKRTIRMTKEEESKAAAHHKELERGTKVDIAGSETKKALDEQELKSTTAEIGESTASLMATTREMDDALKALEALQPTCMDTGMSYQQRMDKRNEELDALKKALCILDPEGFEKECKQ